MYIHVLCLFVGQKCIFIKQQKLIRMDFEEINQVLRDQLVTRGAVLFRNLGYYVPDSIAFSKLISGLGERMPYIAGMATRDEMEKSPGVMNASDDPEECTLEPHLEMCYREEMPSKCVNINLFFQKSTKLKYITFLLFT